MKFGALLRSSALEVPELQSLFVCYKQLKKRLKRLPARAEAPFATNNSVRENQRAFVSLLISDIQAFNETFVEREEQSVILLSLIEERAAAARDTEEVAAVYKSFVDFHGQTLMLVHWSILAYTSVLKILKKHHKRTGLQVQEFNMQQLLSQPFCSVELISGLVRKAEAKAQELAGRLHPARAQGSLSAASPSSSPVAELISAARASVKEIADTAAQGNEALDEHLQDQPTSSDEASAGGGEAEVLSGPSARGKEVGRSHEQQSGEENLGGAHSSKLAPAGTKSSMKRKLSREGDVAAVKRAATEPPTSSSLPRLPQNSSAGPNGREPDLVRTASVAGDSEHIAEGLAARADELGSRCGVCSNGTPGSRDATRATGGGGSADAGGLTSRAVSLNGGDSDSGSRRSPQLTMGQGWGRGGSQNILRQTQMALGLWEQLHYTASTPSTVVPPLQDAKRARGSANSAA